jgi:hypothetical protein
MRVSPRPYAVSDTGEGWFVPMQNKRVLTPDGRYCARRESFARQSQ